MQFIPELQVDADQHPELLNPEWVHWRASTMSVDGRTPAMVGDTRFMEAARMGGLEIAKKLSGKPVGEFTWELQPVPSGNGLFRVKVYS